MIMTTAHLLVARMIIAVVHGSFAFTIMIMMAVSVGSNVGAVAGDEGVPDPGPSRNEVSEVLHRHTVGVDPSVVIPFTTGLVTV